MKEDRPLDPRLIVEDRFAGEATPIHDQLYREMFDPQPAPAPRRTWWDRLWKA